MYCLCGEDGEAILSVTNIRDLSISSLVEFSLSLTDCLSPSDFDLDWLSLFEGGKLSVTQSEVSVQLLLFSEEIRFPIVKVEIFKASDGEGFSDLVIPVCNGLNTGGFLASTEDLESETDLPKSVDVRLFNSGEDWFLGSDGSVAVLVVWLLRLDEFCNG